MMDMELSPDKKAKHEVLMRFVEEMNKLMGDKLGKKDPKVMTVEVNESHLNPQDFPGVEKEHQLEGDAAPMEDSSKPMEPGAEEGTPEEEKQESIDQEDSEMASDQGDQHSQDDSALKKLVELKMAKNKKK